MIGIDNMFLEEFNCFYLCLVCIICEVFVGFEVEYGIYFFEEEMGLVVVIFGVWLM